MHDDKSSGWMLIVLGLVLLTAFGRLEWIAVLLPVSLVLACAIMWLAKRFLRLTGEKG